MRKQDGNNAGNPSLGTGSLGLLASLLVVFALGMGLRLHALGADTLSLDEYRTGTRARYDLPYLVHRLALGEGDVQPPLMYVVTHFFVSLLGDDDLVLRLQAVLFGSLSIVTTYKLGEILWTKETGLIAAFLLAVNPFHVRYSQVARHYGLMTFLATLSLIFLVKALEKNRWRLWMGYILTTTLSLYNHYFAFLFLPAQLVYTAGSVARRWIASRRQEYHGMTDPSRNAGATPMKQVGMFIASLALVALCFSPWLPTLQVLIYDQTGPEQAGLPSTDAQSSFTFFLDVFTDFSGASGVVFIIWLALFLIGLASSGWIRTLLVLVAIGAPFLFLAMTTPEHHFDSRYVLFALPLYLIGVAAGTGTATRVFERPLRATEAPSKRRLALIASLPVVILGGLSVAPLRHYYSQAGDNPDWRGATNYLQANMRDSDLVLAVGEGRSRRSGVWVHMPLKYYLRTYGIEDPQVVPVDRGLWRTLVAHITEESDGVWAVHYCADSTLPDTTPLEIEMVDFSGVCTARLRKPSADLIHNVVSLLDPLAPVEQFDTRLALAGIYLRTGRLQEAELQLDLVSPSKVDTPRASSHLAASRAQFDILSQAQDWSMAHPLRRSLGLQIALLGYDLNQEIAQPGESLEVVLWWQALAAMTADYTAFIHLIGPDGDISAQHDRLLQDGEYLTSTWQLGKIVREEYDLHIPVQAAPGDYAIRTGIYLRQTGDRLPVWDDMGQRSPQDSVLLQQITVTR